LSQKNFTLLKWNGEYGEKAIFIVKDNRLGKQSLFVPGNMDSLNWVDEDLSAEETKGWQGFENEQIESLEDVVF